MIDITKLTTRELIYSIAFMIAEEAGKFGFSFDHTEQINRYSEELEKRIGSFYMVKNCFDSSLASYLDAMQTKNEKDIGYWFGMMLLESEGPTLA